MAIEIRKIVDKLDHMQADLEFIKKHLVDLDLVLTDEDIESLEAAESDLK